MQKQYIVLDLVYLPEEGQECFEGTFDECEQFIKDQGGSSFMYKIVTNIPRPWENPDFD